LTAIFQDIDPISREETTSHSGDHLSHDNEERQDSANLSFLSSEEGKETTQSSGSIHSAHKVGRVSKGQHQNGQSAVAGGRPEILFDSKTCKILVEGVDQANMEQKLDKS